MLILSEENVMKYLKIDNNKGFYYIEPEIWKGIDQINKNDLMLLIDFAMTSDFEMDQYIPENIGHKAHQIIYKNIYEKFALLLENKSRFKDESEQLFKSAMEKYTNE